MLGENVFVGEEKELEEEEEEKGEEEEVPCTWTLPPPQTGQ